MYFLFFSLADRLQLTAGAALAWCPNWRKLWTYRGVNHAASGGSGMLFAMASDEFLQILAGVRYMFPESCNG